MSERVTEQIVRKHLDESIQQDDCGGVRYWEQKVDDRRIAKLLAGASKSGSGVGKPEFLATFNERPEFLIVIECKADIRKHGSKNRDNPKDFAVDGVLHYAKHLSREFNVLAIAVSGTKKSSLRISHFWRFKGQVDEEETFGGELLQISNYLEDYLEHDKVLHQDLQSLLSFTQELNTRFHKLKIEEANRSLLISAILMALKDRSFSKSYSDFETPQLLLGNIKQRTLASMEEKVKRSVLDNIIPAYSFMDNPPETLMQGHALINLVKDVDERVNSFRKTHKYYDFIGQFYIEFLRYSNSDKGLGIVLTPPHITDFASCLVKAGKDDVVYDNCAGTGGFLISSMQRMIEAAKKNKEVIKRIRKKGIVGVEIIASKSALLCSNMFIHEDGRSNFIHGNCFAPEVQAQARKHKPTIGLLNPPFKSDKTDTEELEFVLNNLETLEANGKCATILPMQCALAQTGMKLSLKQMLLESHTLEAVLSLPDQLFYNSGVGVVVCLMLFTAHQPHAKNKKVWFGYCKEDGFVIRKPKGRTDHNNQWDAIRDNWLRSFDNREEKVGFSVMREISAKDEWCAEAYMETDYSKITQEDFTKTIKNFVAHKFLMD